MGKNNIKLTDNTIAQILHLYIKEGKSSNEIAKILKIAKCTILKYLNKNKVIMREPKVYRKYELDDHFFDNVEKWGEKQSYFLGFIMGDGYHNPKISNLKITLSIKDEGFLKKLNSIIQDREIRLDKDRHGKYSLCTAQIRSPIISKQLSKLGVHPNKTIECHLPDFLNKDNMAHYLRGIIDADGCFCHTRRYIHFSFSGNKFICNEILEYLRNEIGIVSGNIYKDKRSEICYSLFLGRKDDVKKLYNFLYKDATCFLGRKKEVCDKYFSEYNL